MPKAAHAVGVSVTAFKRACRRLDILRWDYTRGPGRRAMRRDGSFVPPDQTRSEVPLSPQPGPQASRPGDALCGEAQGLPRGFLPPFLPPPAVAGPDAVEEATRGEAYMDSEGNGAAWGDGMSGPGDLDLAVEAGATDESTLALWLMTQPWRVDA